MDKPTVLWVDNDRAYLFPYIEELEEQGFDVTIAETATDAEEYLQRHLFDYLIIDVMIPTKSADEEAVYTPQATNQGYQTGLVFWRRVKRLLNERNIAVLVFTVRLDEKIRDEFAREGLPSQNFATKYQLNEEDPAALVERLRCLRKVTVEPK